MKTSIPSPSVALTPSPKGSLRFSRQFLGALSLCVATLSAAANPTIDTPPANATVCPGTIATYTVAASGNGTLSYEWRKNGTPLSGDLKYSGTNTLSLSVSNAVAGDLGNYTVAVTDLDGTTISAAATLTLNTVTTATGPASVNNICPSGSTTLTTTPSGTGPFTFIWRKNGGVPLTDVAPYGGSATAALLINPLTLAEAGTYTVEVYGLCNSVTNTATLSFPLPTITAQPVSTNNAFGKTNTFSVTATSPTAPLTYQWRSNGVNLANNSIISGATTATLTHKSLKCEDAANYDVVIANCVGSVTSSVAVLRVRPVGGVTFDFSTVGQFTNSWLSTENTATTVPGLMEVAGLGVNGTRALDLRSANENSAVFSAVGYDFSQHGQSLTISVKFKVKTPTATGSSLGIGFIGRPDGILHAPRAGSTTTNGDSFIASLFNFPNVAIAANQAQIQPQNRANNATATGTAVNGTTFAVAGNWYLFTATFLNIKNTTANTYTLTSSVQDLGPSGTTPGVVIINQPAINFANTEVMLETALFPAIRCLDTRGIDIIDDIYVSTTTGAPVITCQPKPVTVLQGRPAAFYAYVDGTPPWTYQWFSNGVAIAGATDWRYDLPAAPLSASGTLYSYQINGGAVISANAALTVTPDITGPVLLGAGSLDSYSVGVSFDELLDPVTATVPANYTVSGVTVATVQMRPDGKSVGLIYSGQVPGTFTVTVNGVKDIFGNTINPGSITGGSVAANLAIYNINGPNPGGSVYTGGNGDYDVTAGGADVWGNTDQFAFLAEQKTGDFDVRVRLNDITSTSPTGVSGSTKSGIHVRQALDPGSPMAQITVFAQPGRAIYEVGARPSANAASAGIGGTLPNGVAFPAGTAGNAAASWLHRPTNPVLDYDSIYNAPRPSAWARARRVNNTLSFYESPDGANWNLIGQGTLGLFPSTIYVGMEVSPNVGNDGRSMTVQYRSYGSFAGYPGAVIAFTGGPSSQTIVATNSVSLSVTNTTVGAPAFEVQYVWQRFDGVSAFTNINSANAGASNQVYGPLFITDNGAQIRCVARLPGGSAATSQVATITVTDVTAPTIASVAIPSQATKHIIVTFNEPVTASATVLGNYVITNLAGTVIPITSVAFLDGGQRQVIITTANDLVFDSYGVRVSNVQDLNGNILPASSLVTFTQSLLPAPTPRGVIVQEFFMGLNNSPNDITMLTANQKYLGDKPDLIMYTNAFGINSGTPAFPSTMDNYGGRIYSYFVPPTTGAYRFWIRGDDFYQLLINTNTANSKSRNGDIVIPSSFNYSPNGAETAEKCIDNNINTKYLNFDKFNAGFTVTPSFPSTVVGMRFSVANDAPERDPMTFTLEGSTGTAANGPWTVIVADKSTELTNNTTRLTTGPIVPFANPNAYNHYRIKFPTIRTPGSANSMQIAEVDFLDASNNEVTRTNGANIWINVAGANANYAVANSVSVNLTGGQAYYTELRFKEGGGGDGVAMAITAGADVTIPGPTNTVSSFSNVFAFPTEHVPVPANVVTEIYNLGVGGSDLVALGNNTNTWQWYYGAPTLFGYEKFFSYNPTLLQNQLTFDNFLVRVYGYYVPPVSGSYRIWLRSDDASQVFMNTNSVNSTNPAGKVLLGSINANNATYTTVAQNVNLTAGQPYYLETLAKDGGGGDGVSIAIRPQADTSVPAATEILPGSLFQFPTDLVRVGAVTMGGLTPTNPVVAEGGTVSFNPVAGNTLNLGGIGGSQAGLGVTWLKNGVPVNFGGGSYTTPTLTAADNGTVITLLVTNLFSSVSLSSTITVPTDNTAPTIVASSQNQYDQILLSFSEKLLAGTANNPANYTANNGLAVLSAALDSTGTNVIVTTAFQAPGVLYTLTVQNIQDISSAHNTIVPVNIPFAGYVNSPVSFGQLLVERFNNIGGTAIANLTTSLKYNQNLPDLVTTASTFTYAPAADNYGARVSGVFTPPASGTYRFFVRSDDASQLFINTNAVNSTDPGARTLVAREDSCCHSYDLGTGGSISPSILMNAGQQYYIEALIKEGGGGDYVQVAFRGPNDLSIPVSPNSSTIAGSEDAAGQYFSLPPGNPLTATLNLTAEPPTSMTVSAGGKATLTVAATGSPGPIGYQWQRWDGAAFTNVPGAQSATFVTHRLTVGGDDGAQYRALVAVRGKSLTSVTTLLSVVPDTFAPSVLAVNVMPLSNVLEVVFSEPMDVVLSEAVDTFNYGLDGLISPDFVVLNAEATRAYLHFESQGAILLPNTVHTLEIGNYDNLNLGGGGIHDQALPANLLPPTTNTFVAVDGLGGLVRREAYMHPLPNQSSVPVSTWMFTNLFLNPKFPIRSDYADYPVGANSLTLNGVPPFPADSANYGLRMSGWIIAPETANYRFRMVSDDSSWFFLSTDHNPTNLQSIIKTTETVGCDGCTAPVAAQMVPLEGGRAYYFEAFLIEGIGGDYVSLSWTNTASITTSNLIGAANVGFLRVNPILTATPTNVVTKGGVTVQNSVHGYSTVNLPVSYEWRRNGVPVTGATNSTLTVANFGLANEGTYDAVTYTVAGSLTSSVTMVIFEPPVIVQDVSPTFNYPLPGGTVSSTFIANGGPALGVKYQWRKDGNPITDATNSTFTITGFSAANEGVYDCVATNRDGMVTSSLVTNKLNYLPVVAGSAVVGVEGAPASLTLGGTDPYDTLTVIITRQPRYGTLNDQGGGLYQYIPNDLANFNGPDDFEFAVNDGVSTSAPATVTVDYSYVDDVKPYAFAPAVNLTTGGTGPSAVAIGKLTLGTTLDIAVANQSSNTLSILGGNGKGGFWVSNVIDVGAGPSAVVLADFTKDGKGDIAVLNSGDATITILSGNGAGVFTVSATLPVGGTNPRGLVAADFNKDLRIDLALANDGTGNVGVWLNYATGWLNSASVTVPGTPRAIAAGDVNGDLKQDIVVSSWSAPVGGVTVLRGAGNGTFTVQPTIPVGVDPAGVVVADFNKDKKLDIAVANGGSDDVTVMTNLGIAGFSAPLSYGVGFSTGLEPHAIAAADFTRDGNVDLVVTLEGDDSVEVFNGTASGAFNFYWGDPSSHYAVGSHPVAVAVADLDGDKSVDAVVANYLSDNVSLLINNYTPLAKSSKLITREDDALLVPLVGTYGPLNYTILSGPTNGYFTATNGVLTNTTAYPVLTYQPKVDAFGKDLIRFTVDDEFKTSKVATVAITILPVNDQPSFTLASNVVRSLEDPLPAAMVKASNFVATVWKGATNEGGQSLKYLVTAMNPALFAGATGQPKVNGTRMLSYTAAKNVYGTTMVHIAVQDGGGTINGGTNLSATQTFTIEVASRNDPPTLKKRAAPLSVVEDGTSTAYVFTVGDIETLAENLVLTVGTTNTDLVDVNTGVVISTVDVTNRTVTVSPLANANGKAYLDFTVTDADGGHASVTLALTVSAKNDAPSFTLVTNQVYGAPGVAETNDLVATFTAGPLNESLQTPTYYIINNSNPGAFATQPKVLANGKLVFKLKPGVQSATMDVYVKDNGGVLNGGTAVSPVQQITISTIPAT